MPKIRVYNNGDASRYLMNKYNVSEVEPNNEEIVHALRTRRERVKGSLVPEWDYLLSASKQAKPEIRASPALMPHMPHKETTNTLLSHYIPEPDKAKRKYVYPRLGKTKANNLTVLQHAQINKPEEETINLFARKHDPKFMPAESHEMSQQLTTHPDVKNKPNVYHAPAPRQSYNPEGILTNFGPPLTQTLRQRTVEELPLGRAQTTQKSTRARLAHATTSEIPLSETTRMMRPMPKKETAKVSVRVNPPTRNAYKVPAVEANPNFFRSLMNKIWKPLVSRQRAQARTPQGRSTNTQVKSRFL